MTKPALGQPFLCPILYWRLAHLAITLYSLYTVRKPLLAVTDRGTGLIVEVVVEDAVSEFCVALVSSVRGYSLRPLLPRSRESRYIHI